MAFFLLTIPLLPLEFGLLDIYLDKDLFVSLCLMFWYWWLYATNFLIYCATTQDFRTIYRLFMADMAQWIGAASLAERILPPEEREGLV